MSELVPYSQSDALITVQNELHKLDLAYERDKSPAPSNQPNLLINAHSDHEAVQKYLKARCKNKVTRKATFSAYCKLRVFMYTNQINFFSDFDSDVCDDFQDWLMNKDDVLTKGPVNFIYDKEVKGKPSFWLEDSNTPNPAWRPFVKPMNDVTAQQTVARIHTIFQFLCDGNYLSGNPWKLVSPITNRKLLTEIGSGEFTDKLERELAFEVIQAIFHYLDHGQDFEDDATGLSPDEPILKKLDPVIFARRRWFFNFYYLTAARASSALTATLDDIYLDKDGDKMLRLQVKGKGATFHAVPWFSQLENEYYRYRSSMGLEATSIKPAKTPPPVDRKIKHHLGPRHLFLPLKLGTYEKKPKPITYSAVYHQIDQLFLYVRRWVDRHPEIGLKESHRHQLDSASLHWIRHGAANRMGEYASEQLGHRYKATTAIYQTQRRKAQRAMLETIKDTPIDEEVFFKMLEADNETKRRWIKVLEDSLDD